MDDAAALRAALDELGRAPTDEHIGRARRAVGELLAAGLTMDEVAVKARASINELFMLLGSRAHGPKDLPHWHVS